jgi:hypothetical protein
MNNPTSLAASVLEEIPTQVTQFYKRIGKAPNQSRQINLSQVNANIETKGFTRTGTLKDEGYYMRSNFFLLTKRSTTGWRTFAWGDGVESKYETPKFSWRASAGACRRICPRQPELSDPRDAKRGSTHDEYV